MKRAVLEEQNRSSTLRESLRLKETALRRTEQEVDSLGFRNKQLEHRVEKLQEDLHNVETRKNSKQSKSSKNNRNNNSELGGGEHIGGVAGDPILTEEFQKKIFENAHLASAIADREAEIILFKNRVAELERLLTQRVTENSEMEKRMRREIEVLNVKNSELETKVAEAASIMGSEDGLSVTGSDHTPIHTAGSTSSDDRIAQLEKEISHWRTQYEILKINDARHVNPSSQTYEDDFSNDCDDLDVPRLCRTKEQQIYAHFTNKLENLLTEKFCCESQLENVKIECKMLENNLELSRNQLEKMVLDFGESQRKLLQSEEDFTTTRVNYEEQITVLTEQVIVLSDQLANLK